MKKILLTNLLAVSWILSASAWAAPPFPKYALIEIPSIVAAGGSMSATAINDRDEVVGNATQPDGAPFYGAAHAFFYQHSSGAVNQLTFGSEQGSYAFGINDKGIIAGYAENPDPPQAVLWSSSGGTEGLGAATIAMAVNEHGTVVGNYDCEVADCAAVWSGPTYAFAALPGLSSPPPPPYCFAPPPQSNALAINNRGHIVGWAETAGDCGGGAVEWHDGNITLLVPDAANGSSVANALNDQDDVVGVSGDHAFLYHRGRLSDLGTLPGDLSSSANAINDNGEIVGVSQDVGGNSRAFVYVNCQMYDLNSLVDAGSVTLQEAVGINSQGWIAASGTRDGQQYAYLLKRVR
jgi:probable HAF family extracellular repeat protein